MTPAESIEDLERQHREQVRKMHARQQQHEIAMAAISQAFALYVDATLGAPWRALAAQIREDINRTDVQHREGKRPWQGRRN